MTLYDFVSYMIGIVSSIFIGIVCMMQYPDFVTLTVFFTGLTIYYIYDLVQLRLGKSPHSC